MPSLTSLYSLLPFLFIVLLILQGISIFARSGGSSLPKYLGTMSILMAAAILLTEFLTFAHNLIFSPEWFALIGYSWSGVASLVFLLSVGSGIGWHAALRYLDYPSRLSVLLLTGSALGFILVLRNQLSITADYDSRLSVFACEFGWLPWNLWLLGWIAAPILPNLNVRHVWRTALQQWTTEHWQGKLRVILSYMSLLTSFFLLGWILLNLLVGGKFDPVMPGKIDIFSWGAIDGSLYAMAFIVSWFIWMEFAVQVGLGDVSSALIPIVTPLILTLEKSKLWVRGASGTILASAKAMSEVNSVWSLVGKVLIGMIVLIAINELPNVGKTVIVPFETVSLTGEKEQAKTPGNVIAERVINRLGILKGLETDVISTVAGMNQQRQNKWGAQYANSISTTDALTAALSKSQDITIFGVPIPLKALVAPIQTPIRFVLGVREVSGSLHMEDVKDTKSYTLLVTATTGETWRVTHSTEGDTRKENPVGCSGDAADRNDIDQIADELAFYILATDTTLKSLGMTELGRAYRPYIVGMDCLKRFKDSQRYGHLAKAIENFRKALQEDQNFALAYFRLGYALWLDGQSELAITELRTATKLTENFSAATMLLAAILQQLDLPKALPVPMTNIDEEAKKADEDAHREEAKMYLLQIVSAPRKAVTQTNLAAAYLALCQDVLNSKTDMSSKYLAYFFCRHSINFALQYPSPIIGQQAILTFQSQGFSAQANQVLAYALQALGELLMDFGESTLPDPSWHCRDIDLAKSANVRRTVVTSSYPRKVLAFYEIAKAVMPADPMIKCYAAAAAVAFNDPNPMKHLQNEAEAHVVLADTYRQHASSVFDNNNDIEDADYYYSRALDEYQEAIDRDRWSFEALNGFAYTMWEWRFKMGVTKTQEQYFQKALPHAQKAVIRAQHMPGDAEVLALSTLGELHLAHGSFDMSQKYLKRAYDLLQHPGQDHANYDSIRWDFAQALLCSSGKDRNLLKGKTLLKKIRTNDNSRESKRFNEGDLKVGCALPLVKLGINDKAA